MEYGLTFLKSPSPKFGLRASFNSDKGRFTELGIEPRETSSGSRTSTMRTSCLSALSTSADVTISSEAIPRWRVAWRDERTSLGC